MSVPLGCGDGSISAGPRPVDGSAAGQGVAAGPVPNGGGFAGLRRALASVRRPRDIWCVRELRYIAVGALNTAVGYALGVGLYLALSPHLHIVAIGVIGNVFAISFSFTTYKLLVFQTQSNWLREYVRSYVVYSGSAVLGIALLWLLVDGLAIPIWFAQGLTILIGVIASYIGHARFTFRRPMPRPR